MFGENCHGISSANKGHESTVTKEGKKATEMSSVERILQEYPALHQFNDPVPSRIQDLLRNPFPAQSIAMMGIAKALAASPNRHGGRRVQNRKTLISLGAIHVHSEGKPFTGLAMVPPHLVEKWARETFLTLPGIRVFLIEDLRNGEDENKFHGINGPPIPRLIAVPALNNHVLCKRQSSEASNREK